MGKDTDFVQAVDPFLNRDGKRLVRITLAIFRMFMLGGLIWTGFGVQKIGQHMATSPSRDEFIAYQRAQDARWNEHERKCEELIRRVNNSLNTLLRNRSPRDLQTNP